MANKIFFISVILLLFVIHVCAQNDSTKNLKVNNGKEVSLDTLTPKTTDTTKKVKVKKETFQEKHDAHKATIRSAIIPGWGQAYNREYWKIPLVYGAISIPTATFLYNNRWYQRTKTAYSILVNGGDTNSINPKLKNISVEGLQSLRTTFRKDRDYSVLFFLFAWALNVADATVFGHLKNFDVSQDLSLQVQPDYNPTNKTTSLSFVLNPKPSQKKLLPANF